MARFESILRTTPQALQDWSRGKESTADILVVGNSGTGKSALINGMTREDVAEEALDIQRKGTIGVQAYSHPISDSTIKFWDSPGLQDGMDIDDEYIRDMKEEGCDDADLVLYCIKMSNTRFQPEDHETIVNLTKGLGKDIWEKAIFVLTFANDVVSRLDRKHKRRPGQKPVHVVFKDLLSTWKEVLSTELKKAGVDDEIAECIPVVPAGYEIEKLCQGDDINWMESLWHTCKVRREELLHLQSASSQTDGPIRTMGEPTCGLGVQIEQLDRQYTEMKSLTLRMIKNSGIPLSVVQSWVQSPPSSLKTLLRSQKRHLCSTTSVDQLFIAISTSWNLFHPALLEHLISKLGNGDLKARMDHYMDQLRQFCAQTKLGDFLDKWVGVVPPGYQEFVLEFGEGWRERTVEDLEQFRIQLSRVQGGNMCFVKTAKSSGALYSVVLSLPGRLNLQQRSLYDLLRGVSVLRVMVDGKCMLDLEKLTESGDSLLAASCCGDMDACRRLLGRGAPINFHNAVRPYLAQDGDTALSCASREGHSPVIRLLLSRGAQVNHRNAAGKTPLMIASENGHSKVVYLLLRRVPDPKKDGGAALFCASGEGHASVVRLLLKFRAQVDYRDEVGWTPLMKASQKGHTEVVELLINYGADVNASDEARWTPLRIAHQNGHTEVTKLLSNHGARN